MSRVNAKIFSETPNELKTVEIDIEKKVFNVNGVPFGEGCRSFVISFDAVEGHSMRMDINTSVKFAHYNLNGEKTTDYTYEKHSQR